MGLVSGVQGMGWLLSGVQGIGRCQVSRGWGGVIRCPGVGKVSGVQGMGWGVSGIQGWGGVRGPGDGVGYQGSRGGEVSGVQGMGWGYQGSRAWGCVRGPGDGVGVIRGPGDGEVSGVQGGECQWSGDEGVIIDPGEWGVRGPGDQVGGIRGPGGESSIQGIGRSVRDPGVGVGLGGRVKSHCIVICE
ncbi:uncharacterized protein [Macrobrachium rosenbergii]|uniref:uncharacterized protein n=1 Tax=Macrobrachium rosenbergii TaxID=79674 RepID=UPI0034D646F3